MKDLKYYKDNCEEDYLHTPISVLRYITELEKEVESKPLIIDSVVGQSEQLLCDCCEDNLVEEDGDWCNDCLEQCLEGFKSIKMNKIILNETSNSAICPQSKLIINPNAGHISVGRKEEQITISIDYFNEISQNSEWKLLDCYLKNDMMTSKWENKKSGEINESIGYRCPSKQIDLNAL